MRPKTGVEADLMRCTRASYHYAICNLGIRREWIMNNKACRSSVVDGFSKHADIADLFANKYQELYTSVQFDSADTVKVNTKISSSLSVNGFNADCKC